MLSCHLAGHSQGCGAIRASQDIREENMDMSAFEKIGTWQDTGRRTVEDGAGGTRATVPARRAMGGAADEPLFRRYGVVKEWRTKDTGGS
jgi:hypothetical protein